MQPKVIYRFNALLKISVAFLVEIEKNPKIHKKSQSTHNSQNSLEKEEQSWRPHTSWSQNILESTIIKTGWYWHKDRHTEQWDRVETAQKWMLTYMVKWSLSRVPRLHNKGKIISTNDIWKTGYSHAKAGRWTLISNHILSNSKWIKDLNIRLESIKLLEGKLHDIGMGNAYLGMIPKARKVKRDIWNCIKL